MFLCVLQHPPESVAVLAHTLHQRKVWRQRATDCRSRHRRHSILADCDRADDLITGRQRICLQAGKVCRFRDGNQHIVRIFGIELSHSSPPGAQEILAQEEKCIQVESRKL